MKRWQHDQIMNFMKNWIEEEGLCRFCAQGRCCPWSRKGRGKCDGYSFAHEMDCFHLWIAFFDKGYENIVFRKGYNYAEDYPWKNEIPERDVPQYPSIWHSKPEEKGWLKKRRIALKDEIDAIESGKELARKKNELEKVEYRIEELQKEIDELK